MRNIDLYKTPEEVDIAFRLYCTDRHCDGCPYHRFGVDCRFSWALDEVEMTRRIDTYDTPEAAFDAFLQEYNIDGDLYSCGTLYGKWLMEKVPKEK